MPPPSSTRPPPRAAARPSPARIEPLTEDEIDAFQAELDRVPAPLEPLDASMVDGFLCGVLVQPQPVPEARWLAHLTDVDGRALPAGFDATRLHAWARRRHAELDAAIVRRDWFDPWVFELDPASPDEANRDAAPRHVASEGADGDAHEHEHEHEHETDEDGAPPEVDAVYPWVAGFATALELFPGLMRLDAAGLTEPLALLYRHLSADDLEDADDLLAEIETLEPPASLADAVEELVRATLLLADVGRPRALGRKGLNPPRLCGR